MIYARGNFRLLKAQLIRHMRKHVDSQLYDESGISSQEFAIYSLSDPRDIREVRYVGQTSDPRRRFLQHISTARLWIPSDRPWWFQPPRLRPLYDWIRELYGDEGRLPTMVISAWATSIAEARLAERARIYDCLQSRLRLLNVEAEILGGQLPLI